MGPRQNVGPSTKSPLPPRILAPLLVLSAVPHVHFAGHAPSEGEMDLVSDEAHERAKYNGYRGIASLQVSPDQIDLPVIDPEAHTPLTSGLELHIGAPTTFLNAVVESRFRSSRASRSHREIDSLRKFWLRDDGAALGTLLHDVVHASERAGRQKGVVTQTLAGELTVMNGCCEQMSLREAVELLHPRVVDAYTKVLTGYFRWTNIDVSIGLSGKSRKLSYFEALADALRSFPDLSSSALRSRRFKARLRYALTAEHADALSVVEEALRRFEERESRLLEGFARKLKTLESPNDLRRYSQRWVRELLRPLTHRNSAPSSTEEILITVAYAAARELLSRQVEAAKSIWSQRRRNPDAFVQYIVDALLALEEYSPLLESLAHANGVNTIVSDFEMDKNHVTMINPTAPVAWIAKASDSAGKFHPVFVASKSNEPSTRRPPDTELTTSDFLRDFKVRVVDADFTQHGKPQMAGWRLEVEMGDASTTESQQ